MEQGNKRYAEFTLFTTKSFNDFRGRSIHPFCSKVKRDPLQTECTNDRNSVALCNLIRHDHPLPKIYQNFDEIANVAPGDEQYYGGSVALADHCPYIQEFTWRSKNVIVRGSQCQFDQNSPSNFPNHIFSQTLLILHVCKAIQKENKNIFNFSQIYFRTRQKLCIRIIWKSFEMLRSF